MAGFFLLCCLVAALAGLSAFLRSIVEKWFILSQLTRPNMQGDCTPTRSESSRSTKSETASERSKTCESMSITTKPESPRSSGSIESGRAFQAAKRGKTTSPCTSSETRPPFPPMSEEQIERWRQWLMCERLASWDFAPMWGSWFDSSYSLPW